MRYSRLGGLTIQDNYKTDSDYEIYSEANSGYEADIYEVDYNYDSNYAADSGYEPQSREDSSNESDSAYSSNASKTETIRLEDLICKETGRKYYTYSILPLQSLSIKLMFQQAVLNTRAPAIEMLRINRI